MSNPKKVVHEAAAAVVAAQALDTLAGRISSEEATTIGLAVVDALRAEGWRLTVDLGRHFGRQILRDAPQLWDYDPALLAGLARGHTSEEIAIVTATPHGTVRNRIARLRRRLGAANAAHAVAIAYRNGWMAGLPPEPRPATRLSPKQRQVLVHMADGLTNQKIAAELGVSNNTAITYVRRLYAALGADRPGDAAMASRAHAVALGFQHGHLSLEHPHQLADAA